MGEVLEGVSQGEVHLMGLECAVQFILEELNERSDNIQLISSRNGIVKWINGSHDTDWENRFLRNKVASRRHVFDEFQLVYKLDKKFKALTIWEDLGMNNGQRWIHWSTNDCMIQGTPISWALQARNEVLVYLGSAEPEISNNLNIRTYLGSAEPEIRISGLQSPR
ncbi:hypothetical protein PIB30_038450 [Stylosanthes scabra]|uniref:Uncharacterized protein n=1 Tax=Stylosanthes scabra TaxID=79078 RepID=A0ABU6XE74_9FABA|nr:hypothetical protein [Stylosanthes scabra]